MDYTKENGEDGDSEEAAFIEDPCSSGGEGVIMISDQKRSSRKQAARLSRENSPPQEEEDSEQPIEEWMILGGEEQAGDSSIQLNLDYWGSSEDDSGDEDPNMKPVKNTWAVSGKDKKCPTCVLCGIQGHTQKDCPSRFCPSCGLPSHGLRPCERPPIRNQHCQRCGMTGHLSDACPDTWRQFHLTIRLEAPLRPQTVHTLKHKRHHAHCYNCSRRGHYGHECTKRRMVSGTFPSLPYVCHYDTMDDMLQRCTRMQNEAIGLGSARSMCSSDQQQSGEENQPVQVRNRTKQACSRAGRRKTWPERRRERQEVKRLRREAQARREGGLLGMSRGNSDDEACHAEPFKSPLHTHRQSTPLPQKKRRVEAGSRKSGEVEEERRDKTWGFISSC